jgi:acetyl-CoA carboxylase carboxyltransferase component
MPAQAAPSAHDGLAPGSGTFDGAKSGEVVVRTGPLAAGDRPVVHAMAHAGEGSLPLSADGARRLAAAADQALSRRLPLVLSLCCSGPDLGEGLAALDGWGRVARALSACSGSVPVVAVVDGPLLSGPALFLGMADAVVMTGQALAYLSGPAAVAEVTGVAVRPSDLGGAHVHASRSGLASLLADDGPGALAQARRLLGYLPSHSDELPPELATWDPPARSVPELRQVVPASPTGSYDVRRVVRAVVDDGVMLELRAAWAPQLVTALVRIGGATIGVVANQPEVMAGTLDIAASQKGARFVNFCDAFNVPLLTVVDTPGFMPGRDLEWRGMIRHGAELVYAYAEATVPRVCLVLRKAYGGAYIVMDSKGMGNDICIAWPSAEVAVLGAEAAVRIVHRTVDDEEKAKLLEEYRENFMNPYVAAERGYVDIVIDPAQTRKVVAGCFAALASKREALVPRKHGNSPL